MEHQYLRSNNDFSKRQRVPGMSSRFAHFRFRLLCIFVNPRFRTLCPASPILDTRHYALQVLFYLNQGMIYGN